MEIPRDPQPAPALRESLSAKSACLSLRRGCEPKPIRVIRPMLRARFLLARYDSASAANKLLDEAAVVAVPGHGFGKNGAGHIRFATTVDLDRTRTALARIRELKW